MINLLSSFAINLNASSYYEVQVLRCVPVDDGGARLCCSDANYPCDPEAAVTGVASAGGGVE
jgi:hypothetical protein